MRRVRAALVAVLLIGALGIPGSVSAATGDMVFYAAMSGEQEVPSVDSDASGSAYVIVNRARTKLTYVVTYRGLTGPVVASHIHIAPPGEAGPVVMPLRHGRSPMIGTLYAGNVTPAGGIENFNELIDAMRSNDTYVNLHTAEHPAGELRGQLRFRPADQVFSGALSADAEVPPAESDGTGSAFAILDGGGSRITYVVTYRNLTGPVVASHIHLAPPGEAGPIILPLRAGSSPMVGSLYAANLSPAGGVDTLAEAFAAIRAGRTYVNLHTAAYPAGEVRAQLR